MDRKEWRDKRRDSAKTRGENWLRQNAQNIAERTLGEEFYQLALANNMSLRYQQSLKIRIDGLQLMLELDYSDQDGNVPLGLFFEEGTKDHWIEPVEKEALHWVHTTTSIPASADSIMASAAKAGGTKISDTFAPTFSRASKQELKTGLERFYKESAIAWQ